MSKPAENLTVVMRNNWWLVACVLVACGGGADNTQTGNQFRPAGTTGTDAGSTTSGDTGSDTSGATPSHRLFGITSFVSDDTVEIRWSTDAAATSVVTYNVVGGAPTSVEVTTPATKHVVALNHLDEGDYQFEVASTFADATVLKADNGGDKFTFRVAVIPVITNVASSFDAPSRQLIVTWTTNTPSNSRVDVGHADFDLLSANSDALVEEHSVSLTISDAGAYVFRVVSIDATGDMAVDDNHGAGYPFTVAATGPVGTSANPIVINVPTLPTSFSDATRNTASSPQSDIDAYPPATQSEKGPEYIYVFTLTSTAVMTATVSDGASVDIDLHLLSSLAPVTLFNNAATSRNDAALSNFTLAAGTYYLALDTYGSDATKAGAYTLNVSFAPPSTNSSACTDSTRPTPNGVPSEISYDASCPNGMIRIPASPSFCIDKFEALLVGLTSTNAAFAWSPYSNPGTQKTKALSVANMVPQGYINRNQAEAACTNAGKRLCESDEWLRACQSSQGYTYPYSRSTAPDSRQPGVCYDARAQHPAVQYFGPGDPDTFSKLGHPCINQLPNSLGNTGTRAGCVTTEGALDMMGNLHEWVNDLVASGPRAGHGQFRGGFYVDTVVNGNGCLYDTTAHDPSHWDYSTGFRCCK